MDIFDDEDRCICGEPFDDADEVAEVYNPNDPERGDATVCHVICIPEGFVLA